MGPSLEEHARNKYTSFQPTGEKMLPKEHRGRSEAHQGPSQHLHVVIPVEQGSNVIEIWIFKIDSVVARQRLVEIHASPRPGAPI